MVAKTKGVENFSKNQLEELFGEEDAARVLEFVTQKVERSKRTELRKLCREAINKDGEYAERYEELMVPVDALTLEIENHFKAELGLPLPDEDEEDEE